ncbi:type II toxin-antitoxin system PemK/MazF family toxin [Microbacterium sp.]|uniref:type II toxin-antitoxin system PemK/MazF family toxin n=1 Tax=Microbacterium sp. TaxID=51671 RepID=UPI003C762455
MRRGDIWLADLDPAAGSEAAKTRPVVIVSNNARNEVSRTTRRGVMTIVPLTTNVARVLSFQVLVRADERTGLTHDSKAQAEQVRSVDVSQLSRRLGALDARTAAELDTALLVHLALD